MQLEINIQVVWCKDTTEKSFLQIFKIMGIRNEAIRVVRIQSCYKFAEILEQGTKEALDIADM